MMNSPVVRSPGSEEQSELHCSIGVMAYNEAGNIGRALQALLEQRTTTCVIDEVVVVASGCTDGTEEVVREFSSQFPIVRLVSQLRREGKASAVNVLLRNVHTDIVVMVGADTIPEPESIQRLVEPFADPEIGMTGGHPVPLNDPRTFMGFAAHLLWELHHQISLHKPKMGEMTAFRRIFHRIPVRSAVDEAAMEPLVVGQGYKLRYVPEAVVRNRGPQTVGDFMRQRRRIYSGHLRLGDELNYRVSTMSWTRILAALLNTWRWDWRYVVWVPAVAALETYGRLLGWSDVHLVKREHAVWERVSSTKVL